LGGITRRREFSELEKRADQRFEYSELREYPLDLSGAVVNSLQSVMLYNETTGKKERVTFYVSHNQFFPLTGQRHVYGMIQTEDGRFVQIEFSLGNNPRIVAYLRTPPIRHFSPMT